MMLTTTGNITGQVLIPCLVFPTVTTTGFSLGTLASGRCQRGYTNVRANPQAIIEYGGASVDIMVREASQDEADAILGAGSALFPGIADYGRRSKRKLDVFVMTVADT